MSTAIKIIPRPHFIDFETVRVFDKFPQGTALGDLFIKRFKYEIQRMLEEPSKDISENENAIEFRGKCIQDFWEQKAGTTAEFGKIVCASIGKVINGKSGVQLWIKTIAGANEQKILLALADILNKLDTKEDKLCAHNGKEFDFPFAFRRMFINKIEVPKILNTIGVKPYELSLEDTMEMWSGSQWKHKASLPLLCELLGFETPKDEMDGSMVGKVYWDIMRHELPFDHDEAIMTSIGKYCPKDIVALVNIYCRLKGYDGILPNQVFHAQ